MDQNNNLSDSLHSSLQQLTQQVEHYQSLYAALDKVQLIIVFDDKGLISEMNSLALSLLSMSFDECMGLSFFQLSPLQSLKDLMKDLQSGKPQLLTKLLLHGKKNQKRWLNASFIPQIQEGELIQVTMMGIDITPMIMAHEHLLKAAQWSTVGEMTAQLTHEINNPLSIILGRLNLIYKRFPASGTEQGKQREQEDHHAATLSYKEWKTLMRAAERVINLVKGIRNLSLSGKTEHQEKSLVRTTLTNALLLLEKQLKLEGVALTIQCSDELTLQISASELSQILINLLQYCLKNIKGKQEKWIILKAYEESQEQGKIIIEVIDSSRGLTLEEIDVLTAPSSSSMVHDNIGLGPSIMKKLLEKNDAYLEYDFSNKNTCFKMFFPKPRAISKSRSWPNP